VCLAPNSPCPQNTGTCTNGTCVNGATACGGLGQQACAQGVGCTSPYTVVNNGRCEACGGQDQRCCASTARNGGDWCAAPFACNPNNPQRCQPCGGNNQPCCPGSYCPSSTNHRCSGGDTCN
jgi:hypothetical protein